MRPSKFSEEQIVEALRQVKAGTPAVHMCRELGITQTTFYRWRNKHNFQGVSEMRELRTLRDENERLKQMVANLLLDKQGGTDARGRVRG